MVVPSGGWLEGEATTRHGQMDAKRRVLATTMRSVGARWGAREEGWIASDTSGLEGDRTSAQHRRGMGTNAKHWNLEVRRSANEEGNEC